MHQPAPPSQSIVVIAAAAAFCMTVAGVVVIAVAAPESANPGSLVGLLLAAVSTFIPAVLGLVKISGVEKQVTDLSNGKMDAKIRDGVTAVLDAREAAAQPLPVQLVGDPAVTYPEGSTQPTPEPQRP